MTEKDSLKEGTLLYALSYVLPRTAVAVDTFIQYIKSIEHELTLQFVSNIMNTIEYALDNQKTVMYETSTWHSFLDYLKIVQDKLTFVENSSNKELAFDMYETLRQINNSLLGDTNIEKFIVRENVDLETLAKSFLEDNFEIESYHSINDDFHLLDYIDIKHVVNDRNELLNQELITINNIHYLVNLYK